MSKGTPSARGPATGSLADEEGVKRIVVDSVFGRWSIVNAIPRCVPGAIEAVALIHAHHARWRAEHDARPRREPA